MFGYVNVDLRSLPHDALKEYRSYYCGLCRALSKNYGAAARWLLSFDTVFLFIILSAMERQQPQCTQQRCPYHFGAQKTCFCGDIAEYCADVTVILAYLNFEDDIADSKSHAAAVMRRIYRRAYDKSRAKHPQLSLQILHALKQLDREEKTSQTNPDIPANIFGQILKAVFAYNKDAEEFGYMLGKAIYLTDAACDFKSDLKHKRYNPFVCFRMSELDSILNQVYSCCALEYEKLELYRSKEIADNVIYSGIQLKYELLKRFRGKKYDGSV